MYKQPEREHSYSREQMRRELIRKSYAEKSRQTAKKKSKIGIVITVLIIAILICGGILAKILIDKGAFVKPGEVILGETLTNDEKQIINDNLLKWQSSDSKVFTGDITYSAKTVNDITTIAENEVVTSIEVPTVDFYDNEINISSTELETKAKYINIKELTSANRVVSVDNNYFFDNPKIGGRYRVISYETTNDDAKEAAVWMITNGQNYDQLPLESKDFLSFAQTGVTALTRAMTTTLNSSKANGRGSYFADNIKDFLSKNDLTHISNEVSFIDGCKGGSNTMSLCADWRSLDSITAIGTNIVELTGNHNNNYGTQANIDTINKYHELGMKTFGGGINETEAAKPLNLEEKGQKITLLGYNHSTSTKGNGELSDGSRPGANGYSEAKAKSDIETAKANGDFVIVDVQYSECWSYPDGYTELPRCDYPINGQQDFFRHFIDMGADMVIGTQAHHPQTFEIYNGKTIYYGLGNLFFDQTYWPGTQRGLILTHYFWNGNLVNTRISPTWYDTKHQVYLTNEEVSEKFIARLIEASPEGK